MRLLKGIYHHDGINPLGRAIRREAVRGILLSGSRLLMIYSTKNGDYKFPGGGVKRNESHEQALAREVLEECGARIQRVAGPYGKVIEYDLPLEPDYDVFMMTSSYYHCLFDPQAALDRQHLDDYEADLGFRPAWVDLDAAIRTTHAVLQASNPPAPRWTKRDTFVLEHLRQDLYGQG
jgi:8-oxo-dGTP pyrophosphatase MutT (NUDIX family)